MKAIRPRLKPQVPIKGYIVDRYCAPAKIAVELDGPFHDPVADARRDAHLASIGIHTIRIPMGADIAAGALHVQRAIRARTMHQARVNGDHPGACAICLGDRPSLIARDKRGILRGLVCSACATDYRKLITAKLHNPDD